MILVLVIIVSSCNKEVAVELSNEASLLSLEIEHDGNTYTTSIDENTISLSNSLPFTVQSVLIKSIEISPKAETNRIVGDTLFVDDSPVLIEVTSENKRNEQVYILTLSVANEPDYTNLLFEESTTTNCAHYSTIPIGNLKVENNVWNASSLPVGSYSQCIYTFENEFLQLLGWQWQYPDNAFGVNAYPQFIYGWKPWQPTSTTSNLPKRISDIRVLKVTYDAEVSRNDGDYNLAFDNWINSSESITPQNILFEFMIWEEANNLIPFGDFQENVTTNNGIYMFYMGEPTWEPAGTNWTYLAFQRIDNRSKGTVDIDELLLYLVNKSIVSPSNYLASIELGNEVGNSTGQTIIKEFNVEIE